MAEVLVEQTFAKAQDLLGAFGPGHAFLTPRSDYIFRGVSSDRYDLAPKAYRPGALESFFQSIGSVRSAPTSISEAQLLEAEAVMAFCSFALRSGLPLPEDSQFYRNAQLCEAVTKVSHEGAFPPPIHRSLYALAQHYGVPTSFLDWSYDPLVALYFAVSTRHRDEREGKAVGDHICIWALNLPAARIYFQSKHRSIELVTAPYEMNPNLRAQRGCFTLLQWDSSRGQPSFPPQPLNQIITGTVGGVDTVLYKLRAPASELVFLRAGLFNYDYHAARIYPGYGSIVDAMKEHA